ncbi:MAG: SPOR domain-containing protein [Paludibacterium sp.]|uniref:SPOR domain-containing protein n=1 Tax=Paludibacterium sp. TaxID=1917523 RepID=UPI0025E9CB5A|nr:SPOR domain-containing protein [Paludibacterium sp.]MBV8049050.1 SPOR domain-containing protein [Paludibacterium sp.]MBV8649635.1 SPOR domain-containing protein [Paludibacterium sp.]
MKWFLGLIVALNLFVGAVVLLRQHDPVNIHSHEVSPEQLKVLPADWQPDANASAPFAASAPVSASAPIALAQTTSSPLGKASPAPAAKAEASAVKSPAAKPAEKRKNAASAPAARMVKADARQCAQWGDLNDTLLARVKGGLPGMHLAASQLESQAVEGKVGAGVRYWVYIPASASTAALSAELKGKGFDNYVVQNVGDYKGALSLGLFGKPEGAQALADRLKKAGYDKAAVLPRGKTTLTRLVFKGLSDSQMQTLTALQKRLTPGVALQTTACAR